MTRWEYAIDRFGVWTDPNLQEVLDGRGADGWELIAINWDAREVVFKRPGGEVR